MKQVKVEEKKTTAIIQVSLPADAKLFFDGVVTKTTSENREFESPELKAGELYEYTLKAEMTVDGKTKAVTKKIQVRAGETTKVEFTFPTSVVAR